MAAPGIREFVNVQFEVFKVLHRRMKDL